jgi:hypothetical protein
LLRLPPVLFLPLALLPSADDLASCGGSWQTITDSSTRLVLHFYKKLGLCVTEE